MQDNSASVHYSCMPSLRRAFTPQMHYAENECAMPIRLHCNELRALCLTTNALCRTAEFGALLLKCVLIVYIWPEKGYKARGVVNRHSAPRWHWSQNLGYWISMLKLNVPAEIHWRRSNNEQTGSYSNEICRSSKRLSKLECSWRNELSHAAFSWEGAGSQWEKV